jgi:nucleoside-diphosphate-sugar epimerase
VVTEDPGGGPARDDVGRQRLDIARAGRLLGWRPRRGTTEALRDQLAARTAAGGAQRAATTKGMR